MMVSIYEIPTVKLNNFPAFFPNSEMAAATNEIMIRGIINLINPPNNTLPVSVNRINQSMSKKPIPIPISRPRINFGISPNFGIHISPFFILLYSVSDRYYIPVQLIPLEKYQTRKRYQMAQTMIYLRLRLYDKSGIYSPKL